MRDLITSGILTAVFMVVLSFRVDLFYSTGDPRSTKRMIIAYVLFSVSFTIAAYGPLALFAEAYMAAMGTEQYGLAANYYDFALSCTGVLSRLRCSA